MNRLVYGATRQSRLLTEFLLLVANYKKALLIEKKRRTIDRHLEMSGVGMLWGTMGQKRKEMLRNKEMNGAHVRRDGSTSSTAQGPCFVYCFPQSPLGDTEQPAAVTKEGLWCLTNFWFEPQLCNSY